MVKIAAARIRAAATLSTVTAILCEQSDSSDRKRKKAKDQEGTTTAQFEGYGSFIVSSVDLRAPVAQNLFETVARAILTP